VVVRQRPPNNGQSEEDAKGNPDTDPKQEYADVGSVALLSFLKLIWDAVTGARPSLNDERWPAQESWDDPYRT